MRRKFITVPKDGEAVKALDYNEASADQLIEIILDDREFYAIWKSGFFDSLNDMAKAIIDDFEDHAITDVEVRNFPSTDFVQADMRQLSLSRKFDAIIAWHSFFHLPPEDQPSMFQIFKNHLNSNGVLLFNSGKEYGETWVVNKGANLFHGSLDTDQYRSLLEAHGFHILQYREDDPECGNANVWMAQLSLL